MATKNRKDKVPATEVAEEIRALTSRARQGDVSVLPALRELLTARPVLWRHFGDLAARAEFAWAGLAAGPDLLLREALLRQAESLRQELGGPNPSPVERLLVGRVVACWLQMNYLDCIEAQALNTDEKPRLAGFRAKRQEQAHRMYLSALAALVTLRKLLPGPTVIAVPSPGEQPRPHAALNKRRNGHAPALPNGGHNRLAGYFDEPPASRRNGCRQEAMTGIGAAG